VQHILASGKEVNLTLKNNHGKTPIYSVKEQIWEYLDYFDIGHPVLKEYFDIEELLESFERNPNETRIKLRIQLGYPSNLFFL